MAPRMLVMTRQSMKEESDSQNKKKKFCFLADDCEEENLRSSKSVLCAKDTQHVVSVLLTHVHTHSHTQTDHTDKKQCCVFPAESLTDTYSSDKKSTPTKLIDSASRVEQPLDTDL